MSGGSDLPRLELRRLRNTWIATHLQAMGFREFLTAAGIRQTQTLFDIAAREPEPDLDEIIAALDRGHGCS